MKRLFFALWPEQVIRDQCKVIVDSLPTDQLQTVANLNLHITLAFLGQVTEKQEAAMLTTASTINIPTFSITFDQINFWSKPGILCLTNSQYCLEIDRLASQLALIAEANGIELDKRPYKPHITLVRKANKAFEPEFTPLIWQANSFCLVESYMNQQSTHYQILKTFNN